MRRLFGGEIGAIYDRDARQCSFRVWAPVRGRVDLKRLDTGELIVMNRESGGYWSVTLDDVLPGMEYFYRLDTELELPDPASHHQPDVHGPSLVVDHESFKWEDDHWHGIPLNEMIQYELHVGTLSSTGDFFGLAGELDRLAELGVNTLEVMPVAQFPGSRNWGYDGVYPFAVHDSYGGPDAFKYFVNEAHKKGMAIVLDVVYNHLGPEGNYLAEFGPYFTDAYKTPWGTAVNFDGRDSDEVRRYFLENAVHWYYRYHVDGLRLDAVHAIYDRSAFPFLSELQKAKEFSQGILRRDLFLFAESDLNDSRLVRHKEIGGFELDAQWLDDFHHCVHVALTHEQDGYYSDFGSIQDLSTSMGEGFVYSGKYSKFRRRTHGNSSRDLSSDKFILFVQNHDQIGNRMMGERLSSLVEFPALKLAAGLLLLSPGIPMLFMGEEYGETSPFLYFVSHSDAGLNRAVHEGRKREFSSFSWKGEPPDPSDPETFNRSRPDPSIRSHGSHGQLYNLYRDLILMRKTLPPFLCFDRECHSVTAFEDSGIVMLIRRDISEGDTIIIVFNVSRSSSTVHFSLSDGNYQRILDSSDVVYGGSGTTLPETVFSGVEAKIPPQSFAIFRKEIV